MPKDLVVTPRWEREKRLIGDVAHAATSPGEGHNVFYVWCFGDTMPALYQSVAEGSPVTCLRCLTYGPRGEWVSDESWDGARTREESHEGTRVVAVDTETRDT